MSWDFASIIFIGFIFVAIFLGIVFRRVYPLLVFAFLFVVSSFLIRPVSATTNLLYFTETISAEHCYASEYGTCTTDCSGGFGDYPQVHTDWPYILVDGGYYPWQRVYQPAWFNIPVLAEETDVPASSTVSAYVTVKGANLGNFTVGLFKMSDPSGTNFASTQYGDCDLDEPYSDVTYTSATINQDAWLDFPLNEDGLADLALHMENQYEKFSVCLAEVYYTPAGGNINPSPYERYISIDIASNIVRMEVQLEDSESEQGEGGDLWFPTARLYTDSLISSYGWDCCQNADCMIAMNYSNPNYLVKLFSSDDCTGTAFYTATSTLLSPLSEFVIPASYLTVPTTTASVCVEITDSNNQVWTQVLDYYVMNQYSSYCGYSIASSSFMSWCSDPCAGYYSTTTLSNGLFNDAVMASTCTFKSVAAWLVCPDGDFVDSFNSEKNKFLNTFPASIYGDLLTALATTTFSSTSSRFEYSYKGLANDEYLFSVTSTPVTGTLGYQMRSKIEYFLWLVFGLLMTLRVLRFIKARNKA